MNVKLIHLALAQLSTLDKLVEDADNAEALSALIDNIKTTLTLAVSKET
jgi:hypothetical protein